MVRRAKVLFNFTAQHEDELTVSVGDTLGIIGEENDGWVMVRDEDTGTKGLVPTNYLEMITSPRMPSLLLPLDGQQQPPITRPGSRSNSIVIMRSGSDSNGPTPPHSGRRSHSTTHSPEKTLPPAPIVVVETTPRREREDSLLRSRLEQFQLECDRLRQENTDLNVKAELLENQISNMELSFRTKTDVLERMDAKIKQLEAEKSEFQSVANRQQQQMQQLQQQLQQAQQSKQQPGSSQVRNDSRVSESERSSMQTEIRRLQNEVHDLKRTLAAAARTTEHHSTSSPRNEDEHAGQQQEFRSKLRFFESQSRVFGAMPSSPNPKSSTSSANGSARQKKSTQQQQQAGSNRASTRVESIKNKFETDDGVRLV